MLDIKEIYTISESYPVEFNDKVKKIVSNLQNDGLVVEVQFSTSHKTGSTVMSTTQVKYSAMIIGRGK